jgi:hypothetical protein
VFSPATPVRSFFNREEAKFFRKEKKEEALRLRSEYLIYVHSFIAAIAACFSPATPVGSFYPRRGKVFRQSKEGGGFISLLRFLTAKRQIFFAKKGGGVLFLCGYISSSQRLKKVEIT